MRKLPLILLPLLFSVLATGAAPKNEDDEALPKDLVKIAEPETVEPSEYLLLKTAFVRSHAKGTDVYFRIHAMSYGQKFSTAVGEEKYVPFKYHSVKDQRSWQKAGTPKDTPLFLWWGGDIPAVNYFKVTGPAAAKKITVKVKLELEAEDEDKKRVSTELIFSVDIPQKK